MWGTAANVVAPWAAARSQNAGLETESVLRITPAPASR